MKINQAKSYQFAVTGMHCASCAQLITSRVKKLPGLEKVSASYATEQLSFTAADPDVSAIQRTIGEIGYGLVVPVPTANASNSNHDHEMTMTDEHAHHQATQSAEWQTLLPIAFFTFLVMIWELIAKQLWWIPAPPWPMTWLQFFWWLAASYAILVPGKQFVTAIGRFVIHRVANMDTLIGLGTVTAYVYSTLGFFFPQKFLTLGLPTDSYFDVTIIVIAFVLLGKNLEHIAKQKTGEALRALSQLQAKSASVIRAGKEVLVPIESVQVGELLKVKAGEKIPLDGVVTEGVSSVDEALLTGESLPITKKSGDVVLGGSINQEGVLYIKATKTGESGFLHQVIELVLAAQASKAPIERLADQVSAWFVPIVLVIALVSAAGWLLLSGENQSSAISLAIHALVGVLVIACPCALGLATPTAMIVAMGKAASRGILIKDAATIERLSKVTTIVTDKTGTLTIGRPTLQSITMVAKKLSETEVLKLAAGLEMGSTHPLAHALVTAAKQKKVAVTHFTHLTNQVGVGVVGKFKQKEYWVGGISMLQQQKAKHEASMDQKPSQMELYLGSGTEVLATFLLADELKSTAAPAVKELRQLGLSIALLSGDRTQTASVIAKQVGITEVMAETKPADKLDYIKKLQGQGQIVAMVGDGVNDAPALAQADVGIAMSTGSDSALATANLTLLHGDLLKLTQAVVLAKQTMKIVKQNLFWAFAYNVIGIPLAAGWLYPWLGTLLNPAFAGIAMAMSSVSVVGNSLRLRLLRPH